MKNNLKQIGFIMWASGVGGGLAMVIDSVWLPSILVFIGIVIVVKSEINESKTTSNGHTMFLGQTGSNYPYPHTFRKGKQLSEETIKQLLKRKTNE